MAEAPQIEILNALAEHLTRLMRFKQTVIGWPDGSQKLTLPAVSMIVKKGRVNPFPPHVLGVTNIKDNAADTAYVTGEWEFSIQLDLWCKTSAERYDALERLTQVFFSQGERTVPIITLILPKYHKTRATYNMVSASIPDAAATPLAQEWRVMVEVMASCSQIIVRENEALITQDADVNLDILKD
jgi:hypothetical protein